MFLSYSFSVLKSGVNLAAAVFSSWTFMGASSEDVGMGLIAVEVLALLQPTVGPHVLDCLGGPGRVRCHGYWIVSARQGLCEGGAVQI